MYAEMRAIITSTLQRQATLTVPSILALLTAPERSWASLEKAVRDRYVGLFVKLACGKVKHPHMDSFLLTEKRDAANKIVVELDPTKMMC